MGEQTISCCDEQRQPFHANVQAKYVTILPPRAESLVEARIVRPWNRQHAFLESKTYTDGVVIASALYHPQQQPKIYVRMLNPQRSQSQFHLEKCSPDAVLWSPLNLRNLKVLPQMHLNKK
ncbi:hypothetical protein EB796_015241 [Bugula neritina]|uniref:Uncharacterized protein n=1 Tax=Bugula neritina TaxID=10212 RepID=A0A7J7JJI0_BUGNE|nr:hypothetical protein EB796_015241 [Bugula neritina]